jgi:hypothetical protein
MAICDAHENANELVSIGVVREDPLLVVAARDDLWNPGRSSRGL